MDHNRIKVLLQRYRAGEATLQEQRLLENWYARESMYQMQNPEMEDYVRIKNEMWASLDQQLPVQKKVTRLWPRVVVAASRSKFGTSLIAAAAVAAVVFGVWFYKVHRGALDDRAIMHDNVVVNDIAPGKNGATITLASGQVIELSGAKKGVVVGQDLKYDDSTLVIQSGSEGSGAPLSSRANAKDLDSSELGMTKGELGMTRKEPGVTKVQNLTASTARGQTYQFTLPDGTKVWLNADSKLEFPSNFGNAKQRIVELSGEGYFEVVHNAKQPFRVESKGPSGNRQLVEDIGTAFNINAYPDEAAVTTTVVEGSASVNDVVLKPSQQSILTGANQIKVAKVDIELAVAWKNNQFLFDDEELGSIMRMIGRWYNVEVEFTDDISKEKFGGGVSRFDKVSKVLKSLEETGKVHFKIQGRKIYVGR